MKPERYPLKPPSSGLYLGIVCLEGALRVNTLRVQAVLSFFELCVLFSLLFESLKSMRVTESGGETICASLPGGRLGSCKKVADFPTRFRLVFSALLVRVTVCGIHLLCKLQPPPHTHTFQNDEDRDDSCCSFSSL